MKKKIIHVYKNDWKGHSLKPGFGDFIRGTCHLIEKYKSQNIDVLIDVSQTEYSNFLSKSKILHFGDARKLQNALYLINQHQKVKERLDQFIDADEDEIYIITNIGSWQRTVLSQKVRDYVKNAYDFTPNIGSNVKKVLGEESYATLTIRCGDGYFHEKKFANNFPEIICELIEGQIIQDTKLPIVVASESYELKLFLAKKYGFKFLPHQSQHGAFGNVEPVVSDLFLLKNSQKNYYINNWSEWWSGFVHYTSIIFNIPEMNFRYPNFEREEIDVCGNLTRTKISRIHDLSILK